MGSKRIVLVPDRIKEDEIYYERNTLGNEYEVIAQSAKATSEIDDTIWRQTDAIMAWHELKYTKEVISKLDKCKILVRAGVGFDNVDLAAAGEKGIVVCNVPDYGTGDVADHAMALMLTLARGIIAYDNKVKHECTWGWYDAGPLKRIKDSVLGIIGMGRIGTATAMRAKSFGMKVCFYDPYLPDGTDKALDVTNITDLNDLLGLSDVISIHTPLTHETRGMVDESFLRRLKKGAVLVNTARGGIINLDAVYDALKDGQLKAAGLDVLPKEPPEDLHPLIKAWRQEESWLMGRLIITPHAAFFNDESYKELRYKTAMTVKIFFEGKTLKNIVNREHLTR